MVSGKCAVLLTSSKTLSNLNEALALSHLPELALRSWVGKGFGTGSGMPC